MDDVYNRFPSTKEELQLEKIDILNLDPSIIHLFSELVDDFLTVRHSCLSQKTDQSNLLLKIESALNYVWEQLHTGQWKDVNPTWRKFYSYISLFKTLACLTCHKEDITNQLVNAIKAIDMGLIMGEPILDGLLSHIADNLNQELWKLSTSVSPSFKEDQQEQSEKCIYPVLDESKLIETVHLPSIETFLLDIMNKKPVVITGTYHILETTCALIITT